MGEGEIMKDKKLHFSRIFVTLVGLVMGLFVCFQLNANASTIKVNGLSGSQATITDENGKIVTDQSKMDEYNYYKVTYHWSIPDSEKIEPGDTATFTIPSGIRVRSDVTFNITDSQGQVVGKATIKAGASTGTITFTNIPASFRYDRHGTLSFYGEGKNVQSTDINSWMINKGGWVDDNSIGKNGKPDQLYWNVVINPAGKSLSDVTFTDNPQDGQTIIPSSITANKIVDDSGTYKLGAPLTPTITHNANGTETFNFGNIDYPIYIKYRTNVDSKDVTDTTNNWENVGMVHWNGDKSEQVTSVIKYGGSGSESGYDGSVELDKYAQETNKPLAGAVFDLEDDQGNVIQAGLTTDSNGKIVISNIKDGNYQFVEVKAPNGYQLNPTPIKFTIDNQNSQELHVKLSDFNHLASSSSSSSSSKKSSSSSSRTILSSSTMTSVSSKSRRTTSVISSNSSSSAIPVVSSSSSSSSNVVPVKSSSSSAVLSSSSSQPMVMSSSAQITPSLNSSSTPASLPSSKSFPEVASTSELTSTSRVISNAMTSSQTGELTSTSSVAPITSSVTASSTVQNSMKLSSSNQTPVTPTVSALSPSNSTEGALSSSSSSISSAVNTTAGQVGSKQTQLTGKTSIQAAGKYGEAGTGKTGHGHDLPQTGEVSTVAITVVGIILVVAGIVIYKEQ